VQDHQTEKLSLHFIGQGEGSTRVLEATDSPVGGWLIGRVQECHICWRNALVSKRHAKITATLNQEATLREDRPIYRWEITDLMSTNGTYSNAYRMAPHVPYEINERDVIQFASSQCKIRASYDLDDTEQHKAETEPDEPRQRTQPKTWPDIAAQIIDGPPGVNRWLWWGFCTTAGTVLFWIWKQ